jgi:hypothetical protein
MCGRWANVVLGILQPKTKLCNFDEVRALFIHLATKNHPYPKKQDQNLMKVKKKTLNSKP